MIMFETISDIHPVGQGSHKDRTAGQFAKIIVGKQTYRSVKYKWHGGEKPCRQSTFGAQRLDFELERAALTHEGREPGEHLCEIAAGLALHADGGDQEQEVILADPAMQIGDSGGHVLTESDFLGSDG